MAFYLSKIEDNVKVVSNTKKQKNVDKKYFLVLILKVTD
jgi:hypothetical protein